MTEEHGYGACLSDREYDEEIVQLYSDLPEAPTREQESRVRYRELNLTIDYRLGREYPSDRREALWAISERIEKRRMRFAVIFLLSQIMPALMRRVSERLAKNTVAMYGEVLSDRELEWFFGEEVARKPSLPVDQG